MYIYMCRLVDRCRRCRWGRARCTLTVSLVWRRLILCRVDGVMIVVQLRLCVLPPAAGPTHDVHQSSTRSVPHWPVHLGPSQRTSSSIFNLTLAVSEHCLSCLFRVQYIHSNGIATARIATEHGSFSRIHQVAPICTPTWFLGSTQVGLPNSILICSAVFAQRASVTSTQTHRETDHDISKHL